MFRISVFLCLLSLLLMCAGNVVAQTSSVPIGANIQWFGPGKPPVLVNAETRTITVTLSKVGDAVTVYSPPADLDYTVIIVTPNEGRFVAKRPHPKGFLGTFSYFNQEGGTYTIRTKLDKGTTSFITDNGEQGDIKAGQIFDVKVSPDGEAYYTAVDKDAYSDPIPFSETVEVPIDPETSEPGPVGPVEVQPNEETDPVEGEPEGTEPEGTEPEGTEPEEEIQPREVEENEPVEETVEEQPEPETRLEPEEAQPRQVAEAHGEKKPQFRKQRDYTDNEDFNKVYPNQDFTPPEDEQYKIDHRASKNMFELYSGLHHQFIEGTIRFDGALRGTRFDFANDLFVRGQDDQDNSFIGGVNLFLGQMRIGFNMRHARYTGFAVLANDALVTDIVVNAGTQVDSEFEFFWHEFSFGYTSWLSKDFAIGFDFAVEWITLELDFNFINTGGVADQTDFLSEFLPTAGFHIHWAPSEYFLFTMMNSGGYMRDNKEQWKFHVTGIMRAYFSESTYLIVRGDYEYADYKFQQDDNSFDSDVESFAVTAGIGMRF